MLAIASLVTGGIWVVGMTMCIGFLMVEATLSDDWPWGFGLVAAFGLACLILQGVKANLNGK